MFSIHKIKENGFEKVVLKDNIAGTYAAILPACGAILHEFLSPFNGQQLNVIESYSSGEDFKSNVEARGFLGCKLSPFVCRIHRGTYNFDGKKYTIQKFSLDKNALHGELYDKAFVVIEEATDELYASITLKYEYRAEDPGYPFNYDCMVTWLLQNDNLLSVTTECINKDERPMPMQDGWHPYFNLGDPVDELMIAFQSDEMVEFNNELIPTQNLIKYNRFNSVKKIENTLFDNCFTLRTDASQPMCVLSNPAKKISIEIRPEKSYPYLQIYIPAHRKSIAIENISGAPDAFNNGMGFITLKPGLSAVFTTSYKITHLN
jgi:aldose 1-epimerase